MRKFFSDFSVDRDELLSWLPDRKLDFFPLDWVVYALDIQYGDSNPIGAWIKRENIATRFEIHYDDPVLIAFEDETDAMLFRLADLDGITFL